MNKPTIFDTLVSIMPADAVITDAVIGIFWTFVQTQYGCAVSATAHRWIEDPPGPIIPFAGNLIGMKVSDIVPLYRHDSLTARSLANAAVSACFPFDAMTGSIFPGKAQELLAKICISSGGPKHIALIGHFHFADDLRRLGHTLDIYELDGRCQDGDIPNTQIPQKLPAADIVLMTSSTIVTHATEDILSCCRPDAYKMIVGPTVPVHPCLWDFGFDAICASIIDDPAATKICTMQGANHRQMAGSHKLNYLRP